ncbi:MAG: prepilin-type N-terminal cleavage/methylation domain-containing protein [Oscillospiraceae bacterium]|nr:prepilin-type N-terminal cleavage/methylation domain-containing protein [Oscillospiraceae bacterium]
MKHSLKSFKNLKHNGGFTLTEVLIALLLFGMLMLAIMQMLAFSLSQRTKNVNMAQSIDEQAQMLALSHGLSFDDVLLNLEMDDLFWDGASGHNIRFEDPDGDARVLSAGTLCKHDICVNNVLCETNEHINNFCPTNGGCPQFRGTSPTLICTAASAAENVGIDGDVAGYYREDEFMRITSPRFSGIANELDVIFKYLPDEPLELDCRFYSDFKNGKIDLNIWETKGVFCGSEDTVTGDIKFVCGYDICTIPANHAPCGYDVCTDPSNPEHERFTAVTWVIDFSYLPVGPTETKNHITFLTLPDAAEFVVVDAGARNATAHYMTGSDPTLPLKAIRIMNFSDRWARIKVTFVTPGAPDDDLSSHFGEPERLNLKIPAVPGKEYNFTEVASILSSDIPSRACRVHGRHEHGTLNNCPYFGLTPRQIDEIGIDDPEDPFAKACTGHGIVPCPAAEGYKCLPERNPCEY